MGSKNNKYCRRKPTLNPLKTASYAVEGSNTEVEYVDELARDRRLGKRFKLVSSHPDPLSVIKSLIAAKNQTEQERKPRDYWLAVFDTEFSEDRKNSIARARRLAKKNGIECIETTPSFEFWLRLHFSRSDRPYDSQDDVETDLRQHLPKYSKERGAMRRLMSEMLPRVRAACENADWITKNGNHGNKTEMPSLVRIVDSMQDIRGHHGEQ